MECHARCERRGDYHVRVFTRHREDLLTVRWGYAVLDEGHKIRNPEAEITVVSKRLRTVHRIIMSGAPVQNRLSDFGR